MALLRRLVRSGGFLGLTRNSNTECGIGVSLRYASSDSKKPGDKQKAPGSSKKEEKAGSKKEEKAAPAVAAKASVEDATVGYAKKAPGSKQEEKAASPTSESGSAKKTSAKASKDAGTKDAGKQALEDDKVPQTASAASEGDVAPPAQSTPAPSESLDEVAYPKRRTMPLPEDRPAPEVEEVEAQAAPAVRKAPPRRPYMPSQMAYDYTLPLPKIIKETATKEKKELVSLGEAIRLVKKSAHCRFVETVEVHIQLGVDPKRSDQIVRGAVTLPYGSGKVVKVAVFADGLAAEEALAAGADVVGTDDLVEKVLASGGKLDFHKCIAIPSIMPKLGKIARILGPRGMMPNPKTGTVTVMVADAVRAAKQGRVDFRADKTAIIHAGLGKVNFPDEHLFQNIAAFSAAVLGAKPAGFKKSSRYTGFFDKFYLSSTMGPGVPVTIQSVATASDNYIKSQAAAEAA
ncbi:50S ribosomal protein L1, chloroplastic [Selaginella moellendorffii]|uniref:50S ribosomal protein L1, chloroplastic n=1 Tax=Selaginella moellendorffii TaxID=88036 RepID=UPI000D1C2C82|nr:50S ribosomal protein L1, chloroplastic [Selaginella moellendorffii]|eukprot:XP_024527207.1 50S ribosomal protein L1, chloroplastic [Selaginella moellendorffii]